MRSSSLFTNSSNTDEKRQMLPLQTMPNGPEQTQNNSIKSHRKATVSNLTPNKITQHSLNTTRCTMRKFL